MRRILTFLAAALLGGLLVLNTARAQTNISFGPNGNLLIGNSATDAAASVIRNAAYAPSSTLGLPSTATVSTSAAIGAAEGAAVGLSIPTSVTTGISSAAIARGVLGLAKTTVVGVAIGLATEAALNAAGISFGPNGAPAYNPPPIAGSCHYAGADSSYCGSSAMSACSHAMAQVLVSYPGAQLTGFNGSSSGQCILSGAPQNLNWTSYQSSSAGQACPNGVQFNNVTQCRQGIDEALAAQKIADAINASNASDIATELTAKGQPITADEPAKASMPGTVTSPPSVKTKADGSTETATTTATTSCVQNSCNVSVTNTVVSKDPAGVVTGTTTETKVADVTTPQKQPDIKTCGLPNTPACKIDETGTPTPEGKLDAAKQSYDDAGNTRKHQLETAGDKTNLGFNNAVGLPSEGTCPTISWMVRSRTVAQSQDSDCAGAAKVRTIIEWGISMMAALYITGLGIGLFGYNGK